MKAAVLVIVCVAIAVLLVWLARTSARSSRHHRDPTEPLHPADTTSNRFYRGVDRPAGPDAEDAPDPRRT